MSINYFKEGRKLGKFLCDDIPVALRKRLEIALRDYMLASLSAD